MAWEVYERDGADLTWMKKVMTVAAEEYEKVWFGKQRYIQEIGLNRYRPQYFPGTLTQYESGWDRSLRFSVNPKSLVPVDLNSQLYQYEDDLLNYYEQHQPDGART